MLDEPTDQLDSVEPLPPEPEVIPTETEMVVDGEVNEHSEEEPENEETAIQHENSKPEHHLKPWQFKPGQSGNPSGKPKGTVSLKTFAKQYIQDLTEKEKLEFMKGLDKRVIWEMAEGKPKQDMEVTGEMVSKVIKLDVE